MEEKLEKPNKKQPAPKHLVALKDFRIVQNAYDRKIKAGDDLSDVPAKYLVNLRTEGVLPPLPKDEPKPETQKE